jgi:hypothetical protein
MTLYTFDTAPPPPAGFFPSGASATAFNADEGSASPGSLMASYVHTAYTNNASVNLGIYLNPAVNWTGRTRIRARVKVTTSHPNLTYLNAIGIGVNGSPEFSTSYQAISGFADEEWHDVSYTLTGENLSAVNEILFPLWIGAGGTGTPTLPVTTVVYIDDIIVE